jgi:succinoglycan biosynthesis protein ExoA
MGAGGSRQPVKPFVSVVIPCRNERATLDLCLDSALASEYPADRTEVLVSDGMSDDGSRERVDHYAARDARVRRIDNPARTTPAALNRAITAARGDLILRLDAHSAIAPDYIRLAVEHLESSGADAVGGAMRTLPQKPGPFAEAIRVVLTHRFGVGNSHFRTGAMEPRYVDTVFGPCWRREVFERIGLFEEQLERSQDMEFSLRLGRAGGRILLVPQMEIRYYARSDLASFLRHNWSNGVWAVLPFAYARGIPVRWRHLVPLALVASLLLTKGSAVVALPYFATNLAASLHAAWKERSPRLALLLPVTFGSLHFAYGTGSLWGVVRLAWITLKRFFHDSRSNPIDSFLRLPADVPLPGRRTSRDLP